MAAYVARRLLLMIPTLLGISLVCFLLIQLVPGGPVEQAIAQIQQAGANGTTNSEHIISPEEIERLKVLYGFDKPVYERYWIWLKNVAVLDFGESYTYNEPVLGVVTSKMGISLFFGLTSFFLSYLICIPLGVIKAMKHRSLFDTLTSVAVFSGYVIPGYALGILLIIFLGGGSFLDWFPISNIVSDDFEELTFVGQIFDFLHHMTLPMTCYMLSEFAFLTFLMKNSLLDEIQKEYVLTARMKGASWNRAVFKHALRNSLIPLATRISEIFTVMFAGSLLIERVFDIDGMGLLFYNAMVGRDYPVVLAIIMLSSFMALLGRIFSDLTYVWLDPRIKL